MCIPFVSILESAFAGSLRGGAILPGAYLGYRAKSDLFSLSLSKKSFRLLLLVSMQMYLYNAVMWDFRFFLALHIHHPTR